MNERLAHMAAAAKELGRKMDDGSLVREVLQGHEEEIMQQQHIQLLEGKGSDDNDLRPYYTEDIKPHGYFNSVQTASNYMAWKESLAYPYQVSRGNSNAPNLYVNGRFYDEMEVRFGTDALAIAPKTGYAADIMNKYGLTRFGLSQLKWATMMYEKGVINDIQKRMKEILYE